jgi:hypothetical protein
MKINIENKIYEIDTVKLSFLLTEISEKKYHGRAFTFNYMTDTFADEIAKHLPTLMKTVPSNS